MSQNNPVFTLLALVLFWLSLTPALAFNNANDQLDLGIELYDDHRFENAATTLRELVYDRQFRRLDGLEKELALRHLIFSLIEQGENREALKHSSTLLKRAKSDFGNRSIHYVNALLVQAHVQYRLGKTRDTIRNAEKMVAILERLGSDYRDELSDARSIPSQVRKREWDEKRRRTDLSEFYTQCEAIEKDAKLAAAVRSMHEYLLVGKDYRPKGREKTTFKNTYIKHARENSTDRANRIIFIPDKKHAEDWCVIYPDGSLVDRAVTVPPDDD
jgi:hypothetical protein